VEIVQSWSHPDSIAELAALCNSDFTGATELPSRGV
jgi:hypothetical protein